MTRRAAAAAFALLLAISACQPAPSTAPTASATAPSPGSTAGTPPPAASPGAGTTLADALRDAISVDDILADLGRLEAIAAADGGHRAAGSQGTIGPPNSSPASCEPPATRSSSSRSHVPTSARSGRACSRIPGDTGFEDLRDFKAMLFSAERRRHRGGPRARLRPGRAARRPERPRLRPGRLRRRAGGRDRPRPAGQLPPPRRRRERPGRGRRRHRHRLSRTGGPDARPPPDAHRAGRTSRSRRSTTQRRRAGTAEAAAEAATASASRSTTSTETRSSANVIAETPAATRSTSSCSAATSTRRSTGPASTTTAAGRWRSSRSPGSLPRSTRRQGRAWKVRVAFWTGEEIGLLGSVAYVAGPRLRARAVDRGLPELRHARLAERRPAGLRRRPARATGRRSARDRRPCSTAALDAQGLPWQADELGGGSDHFPFDQAGIPIGGLFSGANEHQVRRPGGAVRRDRRRARRSLLPPRLRHRRQHRSGAARAARTRRGLGRRAARVGRGRRSGGT